MSQKLYFYSPCNVCHRKVSSDSVIKALGVVWHMVKEPDSLPRLGHITVPHLRDDFTPDYLVTIRLKHQVATGYVNDLRQVIQFLSDVKNKKAWFIFKTIITSMAAPEISLSSVQVHLKQLFVTISDLFLPW